MPPRIPTEDDFAPLRESLTFSLHFPDPPETVVAFLILFHGLGDSHAPFSNLATGFNLPGVLAIAVRAPHPLPAFLLDPMLSPSDGAPPEPKHFFWGDDLNLDQRTGELDLDPGFSKSARLVWEGLVEGTIVQKCGWSARDVLMFGFGEGGSLALGLAAKNGAGERLKGVVSIGGALPASMLAAKTTTAAAAGKSKTPVLTVQLDDEGVDDVKDEFEDVKTVQWERPGEAKGEVSMPRNKEEMYPVMQFFADRLRWEV